MSMTLLFLSRIYMAEIPHIYIFYVVYILDYLINFLMFMICMKIDNISWIFYIILFFIIYKFGFVVYLISNNIFKEYTITKIFNC